MPGAISWPFSISSGELVNDDARGVDVDVVAFKCQDVAAQVHAAVEVIFQRLEHRILGAGSSAATSFSSSIACASSVSQQMCSLTEACTRLPSASPLTLRHHGTHHFAHVGRRCRTDLFDRAGDDRVERFVVHLRGQICLDQRGLGLFLFGRLVATAVAKRLRGFEALLARGRRIASSSSLPSFEAR